MLPQYALVQADFGWGTMKDLLFAICFHTNVSEFDAW